MDSHVFAFGSLIDSLTDKFGILALFVQKFPNHGSSSGPNPLPYPRPYPLTNPGQYQQDVYWTEGAYLILKNGQKWYQLFSGEPEWQ